MKPRLKVLAGMRVKRKTLRAYAYYRRNSLFHRGHLGLGITCLEQFHVYESTGKLPAGVEDFTTFSKTNGYANGKWVAKLNQDMIFADLAEGLLISKYELCNTGATRWWWRNMFGRLK